MATSSNPPTKARPSPLTWILWAAAAFVFYLLIAGLNRTSPRNDEVAQRLMPSRAELAADLGASEADLQAASAPIDLGRAEAAARTLGAGLIPATTARSIQSYRSLKTGNEVTLVALEFADDAAARKVAELAPGLLAKGLALQGVEAPQSAVENAGGPATGSPGDVTASDRTHWTHPSGFEGVSARQGKLLLFAGSSIPLPADALPKVIGRMLRSANATKQP